MVLHHREAAVLALNYFTAFLFLFLTPNTVSALPKTNSKVFRRSILLLSPVCGETVSPGFEGVFSSIFAVTVKTVEAVPVAD